MKEIYETPEMEIVEFDTEEVIKANGGGASDTPFEPV